MEAMPAKLTNLPIPIEDQTMESLAALILINNRHLDPKTFGLDQAAPRAYSARCRSAIPRHVGPAFRRMSVHDSA
ncbi:MAG: hypothetical protein Q8M37_03715 [Nevskia sp.]|nr:hypothetical protein [Nevskia sp.]